MLTKSILYVRSKSDSQKNHGSGFIGGFVILCITTNYRRFFANKKNQYDYLCNTLKAVEEGLTTKTTKERMVEPENQLEMLNYRIANEKTRSEEDLLTREMLEEYFLTVLKWNKKKLFDLLLKRVELYEDRLLVYFHFRTKNNPDDPRLAFSGFSFIPKFDYAILLPTK